MAELDNRPEFQRIINFSYASDAAQDPHMRKLVEWILFRGEGAEMDSGTDFYTMMSHFHKRYGIDQDGFDMAMDICEKTVLEESQSGQT